VPSQWQARNNKLISQRCLRNELCYFAPSIRACASFPLSTEEIGQYHSPACISSQQSCEGISEWDALALQGNASVISLLLWLVVPEVHFLRRQGRFEGEIYRRCARTPGDFSINRTEELRSEEMHGELCGSVAISVVKISPWAPCTLWFYTSALAGPCVQGSYRKEVRKSTRCLLLGHPYQIILKKSKKCCSNVCLLLGRKILQLVINHGRKRCSKNHLRHIFGSSCQKCLQILFVEDNASCNALSRFASAWRGGKFLNRRDVVIEQRLWNLFHVHMLQNLNDDEFFNSGPWQTCANPHCIRACWSSCGPFSTPRIPALSVTAPGIAQKAQRKKYYS